MSADPSAAADPTAAAPAAIVLPALDNTMGVLYLSALLSMALWGAGTVQFANYFNEYSHTDPWWLKLLVTMTWLADTAGQGLLSQLVYTYVITHFFDPTYLGVLQPTLLPIMFVTGITSSLAQSWFVSRAWLLSKKNIFVAGGLGLLVLAYFVATIVFYGITAGYTELAQLDNLRDFMHALNVLSMAVDIAIAAVLCTLLRMKRTGFKSTENIINRLVMFSLNTGFACATCAVLTLIFNLKYPDTYIYMIFYFLVCRIYVNSLLASLNSRKNLRPSETTVNSISLSALERSTVGGDLDNHMGRNDYRSELKVYKKSEVLTDSP